MLYYNMSILGFRYKNDYCKNIAKESINKTFNIINQWSE